MAGKPATMGGAYGYIMQAFAKAPPISSSSMTTRSSLYETRSLRHWTGHHSGSRPLCSADSPLLSSPQRLQQEESVAGELWACRLSRSRPHRARVLTETECSSEYEFCSPRRSEWPPYIKASPLPFQLNSENKQIWADLRKCAQHFYLPVYLHIMTIKIPLLISGLVF